MHDDRASRVRIAYHGPKSVFIPTPSEKAEEEKLAIAANARCNPREKFRELDTQKLARRSPADVAQPSALPLSWLY
jgi:hypothetical protein